MTTNHIKNDLISSVENSDFFRLRLLLSISDIDPSFDEQLLLTIACREQNKRMIKILLNDKRFDPTRNNNKLIKRVIFSKKVESLKILLNDPRVDYTEDNHFLFIHSCAQYNRPVIKLLNDLYYNIDLEYDDTQTRDLFYIKQLYFNKFLKKYVINYLKQTGSNDIITSWQKIDLQNKMSQF